MTVGNMLTVVLAPSKLRYNANRSLTKTRTIRASLTAFFSVFLACLLFVGVQVFAVIWSSHNMVYASEQSFVFTPITDQNSSATKVLNTEQVNPVEVQAIVDSWVKKYQQKASVTILDTVSGQVLASSQSDKQYFTASIYKLYVAYVSIQDIDAGLNDGNQLFLNGYTRFDCITRMIQYSDSPCAEKMMNEMGKNTLQSRLTALGLTNTSMASFMTTTADAALVTKKVATGEGLSSLSTKRLQDAMSNQQHRTGLPSGFNNMKVGDKVGFSETDWHDSANVSPKSGHTFTVTVFTENMRSGNIAELARQLQPILEKA
ncbi:MAG: serine hydrolase [bacterium]